ncbi:hypothetical protein [Photobacterium lipolyticum]|uniref:Uncharacterized protein n=1 Tax=Photobacterium lipolyticum TaxID=266810 RepID=A0A2T3MWP3_9GAMM|nr:hypothetical protein [Photobacterium lipolyticum]PSW04389.1 hypothetical protein C9I89_13780 [Photobacterium lipolyticum]
MKDILEELASQLHHVDAFHGRTRTLFEAADTADWDTIDQQLNESDAELDRDDLWVLYSESGCFD